MRIALSFGAEIYRGARGVPLREILKIQKFLLARLCIKLRAVPSARARARITTRSTL